jgi:single-strand DNA-binding protein
MKGINKVILVGHLGKDPEIQTFENGGILAKFSLATTETFKDKTGQKNEQTEWHNLVVWGQPAEIAQKYLRKGSLIYVEGKLRTRSYDDKDGHKKYITEIRVDQFQMLDKKENNTTSDVKNDNIDSLENIKMNNDNSNDGLPF